MRNRRLIAISAITISVTAVPPLTAHADGTTPTTLYVNSLSKQCSDAGTGTAAAPFCTLQAGIDAAVPGDTVTVLAGTYTPATITRSGTVTQPITITGNSNALISAPSGSAQAAFTFTNVSYVTVSDFSVWFPTSQYAYITGSSHVTVDRLNGATYESASEDNTIPGFEVTGSSSYVTLSRNQMGDGLRRAPSIQIDAGSANDVITTNGIDGGSPAIAVTGAPNTDVTSNTIIKPFDHGSIGAAVTLAGASGNSYVENNILFPSYYGNWPQSPTGFVTIGAQATQGTTVDYNVLDVSPTADQRSGSYYAYGWGGQYYQTATAFQAATGQAAHDLIGAPVLDNIGGEFRLQASAQNSTVVNNANSAAPGELTTDINGDTRIVDPLYPQTGAGPHAYYDRGAAQIQPSTATTTITTTANGALGVTAASQDWSTSDYTFDFGDGTTAATGTYGAAPHTYTHPGTYTITVTGTSAATGLPFTDTTTYTTTALGGGRLYDTERDNNGGWWSYWEQGPNNSTGIAQAAVTAMPNGDTQAVAVTTTGTLEHAVGHPDGSWQTWGVPKNNATAVSASLAGMPDGSTQIIEVTSNGALEHTIRYANGTWQANGWGSPAGSTGIAQAAITAMPNGSTQLVAVTSSGTLEHNIRNANGTWQGWRTLIQPGVKVTAASLAGMPNGSTQIIEVTTTGILKHDARNANGSWQASGWGSPAGSTSIAEAGITAMPNGSAQLAAVTTSGVLKHNIRNANGTWQAGGWGAPAQTDLAAAATSPGIAGLPNGAVQIIEVSTN